MDVGDNDPIRPPEFLARGNRTRQREIVEAPKAGRNARANDSVITRSAVRIERDLLRGYSINVKQVVLAFAVEFFIIGLILTAQYLIAEEAGKEKVFAILLFPIGLAVVELARVPLAIAVRTQESWSVKFFAALGVTAAVVVTSFSLSTIAYKAFDPKLGVVNDKSNTLHDLRASKAIMVYEIDLAENLVKQRTRDRDAVRGSYNDLQSQISQIKTAQGKRCSTTTNPDGTKTENCSPSSSVSPAQMKALNDQLSATQADLDTKQAAIKEAQNARAKLDSRPIDEKIVWAENEYRVAVKQSQLHSYTSMILRKDSTELSDGEIKTVESYLIFIPSIAAALASTLLAITAVLRIVPKTEVVTTIPDEAATYLFGPLAACRT